MTTARKETVGTRLEGSSTTLETLDEGNVPPRPVPEEDKVLPPRVAVALRAQAIDAQRQQQFLHSGGFDSDDSTPRTGGKGRVGWSGAVESAHPSGNITLSNRRGEGEQDPSVGRGTGRFVHEDSLRDIISPRGGGVQHHDHIAFHSVRVTREQCGEVPCSGFTFGELVLVMLCSYGPVVPRSVGSAGKPSASSPTEYRVEVPDDEEGAAAGKTAGDKDEPNPTEDWGTSSKQDSAEKNVSTGISGKPQTQKWWEREGMDSGPGRDWRLDLADESWKEILRKVGRLGGRVVESCARYYFRSKFVVVSHKKMHGNILC